MFSVSKRINNIIESPTMKVAAEAKGMQARGEHVIDLSVGEPDFPTPRNIKDAAIEAIEKNMTRYTVNPGTVELRKAIQNKFKNDHNLDYTLNEIIVSNGAKQSIFNAVQSIIYVDDEAIIPAPYWVSYPEMITLAHGKPIIVETTEESGFKITPEQLKNAVTSATKLLILCNPSNPTGSAYTKEELEAIAAVAEEHDFYIISDEIYEKLIYEDYKFVSFAELNESMKKRTIVINGVSKAYAMTGWRIGYAAGPENIIKGINKLQSHSTSNASSISQAATVEALNGTQEVVEEMRLEFEKRRNYFYDAITTLEGITCYKPEGAFYLFPNIRHYFGKSTEVMKIEHSFDLSMYLLYEAKVATVPGSSFGAEGFLRLSYATSMENLIEGFERIKTALAKLK
ncbi:MAG: pyridoxal phosphate-dependent aminotransferase [Ignavibacteriaceae bacterium]|nr:pyridoxal phosphate-dependent aminotransferase [Ignavibacteriaceae bacterium]